ncbi:uncharacterized protein LOC105384335 [Plutella xylostella]|uniref:uncharacterized protein LOC105384335 n=1 Tax=Plutella xylostella TaxID=51655 RepID=UPI0020327E81|nr:uncharacterized protein LOC105384335 [Plutella xylostella]
MGAGGSAATARGGELRLPGAGLRFSAAQLQHSTQYLLQLQQEDRRGRMSTDTESTMESLVQRIVDGAGQKDARFRCCHMLALHRDKKMRSRSLEYLVTLDALPPLNSGAEDIEVQEGPVGYAKIRLSGRLADQWEEFLTPNGYLCRDALVSRWVELIASCAHARGGGSSRVLGARHTPPDPGAYCYVEKVSPPSPPEQRLAIVEGAAWVMVRAGGGAAEAKLVLAVRGRGCVARVAAPLTHALASVHYEAAQTGFYCCAIGPPSTTVCSERPATWQKWAPGLDAALDAHCSDDGAAGRVAAALNALVDRLREGVPEGSLLLVSRYMVSCALRRRVYRSGLAATAAARALVTSLAPHAFLLTLDDLISVCLGHQPSGFALEVPRGSLSRRALRGAAADWARDAACLQQTLKGLWARGQQATEVPPTPSETLEMMLFKRWENLLREVKSSHGSTPSYSRRQLAYLSRLARALMKCKSMAICENHSTFRANLIQATSIDQEPIEDLIHILAIILDQARDLYLQNNVPQSTNGEFSREFATYRSKKWNKLKDYYDASSACLIDALRRDKDVRTEDLKDDCVMMKLILTWLYKGAKEDKKYLGPVLKPYLDQLYTSSLENSWFMEDLDERKCKKEFDGLAEFCRSVHEEDIDPCVALLDAAKKMTWAKALVDFADRFRHVELRLVFPTGDGMAVSFPLKLPSRRSHSAARALTLSRRDKAEAKLRLARRCVLAAFNNAMLGERRPQPRELARYSSTDEILESAKCGQYWRSDAKPDIIPANSQEFSSTEHLPRVVRRRSRRRRPATSYGFPEITITSQSDPQTLRRKYHTLRTLVYTEPIESVKEMRRPRSAGSSVRAKEMSRPSLLETLDFINGVKDALCVEDSCTSDVEDAPWSAHTDWILAQSQPLTVLSRLSAAQLPHLMPGDLVAALLRRGNFTVLQELCPWLWESSEGALFSLHRLARAARSRSSERPSNAWKLPEATMTTEPEQRYRARAPDYTSADEAPQPPPLPRIASRKLVTQKIQADFTPPKRLQELENHLKHLEIMNEKLNLPQSLTKTYQSSNKLNENCTGIINPLYDVKIPKDKFTTKRSKSLGRSFSARKVGLEVSRYNITLGRRSGKTTNDVVTAISGTTDETGLDGKRNFFQRYTSTASVVGDSYKVSRVTID